MKHYGFAQVPRIVIRGEHYKAMTLIELGLYTGLKDICGDDGECFYTYRNLADVLHTSISTLSRYIPRLRDTWKLITAEKKSRSTAGNKHEVYHIRIVNLWQENDTLYKPVMQDCFTEKQSQVAISNSVSQRNKVDDETGNSPEIVSNRNNTVSQRNEDCFYLNDRRRTNNKDNLIEEERDTYSDDAIAHRTHASLSSEFEVSTTDTTLTVLFGSGKLPNFSHVAELPVVSQWLAQSPFDTPTVVGWNTLPHDSRGNYTPPLSGVGEIGDTHGHYSVDAHLHPRISDSTNPSPRSDAPRTGAPADPNQEQALDPINLRTTEATAPLSPLSFMDETPTPEIGLERDCEGADNARNPGGGSPTTVQDETGSYSRDSAISDENEQDQGKSTRKGRGSGTRKPRRSRAKKITFEVPAELRERVDKVYAFLDKLRLEVTHDPEDRFIPDAESDEAICELFKGKPPTEVRMRKVFMGMWNEPRNIRTGYLAKEHMTVQAICKQYKSKAMQLAADEHAKSLLDATINTSTMPPVDEEPSLPMAYVPAAVRRKKAQEQKGASA